MTSMLYYCHYIKTRLYDSASFLFLVALFLLVSLTACTPKPPVYKLSGATMGTTYHITLIPTTAISENELNDLQLLIDEQLQYINQLMSTYIPDSEISNFNRAPAEQWFNVSKETLFVIDYALSVSHQTNGKFDITVSPLINLWGFGSEDFLGFPSGEAIKKAQQYVGWEALIVDIENQQIKKEKPLTIDLSAIAKGYGVDHLVTLLDSKGIERYLVEIGGEIKVKGLNADDILWRLGIETPSLTQQKAQKIISLDNKAIATSGDYRNFFEKEGVRYSHTLDPDTGKPVIHNIASLTVIADTAMEADALATALTVLGEDKALEMGIRYNIPIYMLLYSGGAFTSKHSPAFDQYLSQQ